MDNGRKLIKIDETNFVPFWAPNLSGDPTKSKFGATTRTCAIVIPDPEQVKDLMKRGIEVHDTKPGKNDDPDNYEPMYFVNAILAYRDKLGNELRPPKVVLITDDDEEVQLHEDDVGCLDKMRIEYIRVLLNPSPKRNGNGYTLYINVLYAKQDLSEDPFAELYRKKSENDELPF